MAATYRLGLARRLVNRVVTPLARAGLAGRHTYLLTARGRRSGLPRTTPIVTVEHPPERWLVSPYGEVGWVHNARARVSSTSPAARALCTHPTSP